MALADYSAGNTKGRCSRVTGAPDFIQLAENGFIGDSIVDGPGLRCVIFCQGCPHGCKGCHNPATHPFGCGKTQSVENLYQQIKKYPLCKAITFSGGEPFCQSEGFAQLAEILRKEGYEIASYSGYTYEQLAGGSQEQRRLLGLVDILIDGLYIEGKRDLSLRFRGSSNQRIINVPQSIKSGKAVVETSSRWIG